MKTMAAATLSALLLASTAKARTIFVSNEKGNSISIIDGETLELVKEVPVGHRRLLPLGRGGPRLMCSRTQGEKRKNHA